MDKVNIFTVPLKRAKYEVRIRSSYPTFLTSPCLRLVSSSSRHSDIHQERRQVQQEDKDHVATKIVLLNLAAFLANNVLLEFRVFVFKDLT